MIFVKTLYMNCLKSDWLLVVSGVDLLALLFLKNNINILSALKKSPPPFSCVDHFSPVRHRSIKDTSACLFDEQNR